MRNLRIFLRVVRRMVGAVLYWLLEIILLPATALTAFYRSNPCWNDNDPVWLWLGRYFMDRFALVWQQEAKAEAVQAGEVADCDILLRMASDNGKRVNP